MDLNQILEALGYTRTDGNWIGADQINAPGAHTLRTARGLKGYVGSYVYRTSPDSCPTTPPRPAVHVAQASSPQEAREIHRLLWNVGDCPFIIVVLPHQIRVYSGFRFETQSEDEEGSLLEFIKDVGRSAKEIQRRLADFSAEAVDSGHIWQARGKALSLEDRVDYKLLRNLKALSEELQAGDFHLRREVAYALIGKYIYFHYLRDRRILSDEWLVECKIQPSQVLEREATQAGFERLSDVLEERFNGGIFPMPMEGREHLDRAVSFVASVFMGDEVFSRQLALDFGAYDFSYIPVELLSSIYEQFLHDKNQDGKRDRGGEAGAYYTPEPLADYVLSELEATHPLRPGMKILDPSCGSGVFLVLAYRRLIELHERQKGRRLSAEELKQILLDSIQGVELDPEACSITEFSLIVTLLSCIEPPELHQNETFKFPSLRNSRIFCANFFDETCPLFQQGTRFDWIVGNPPWIGYSRTKKTDPIEETERQLALKWIDTAAERGRPVGKLRAAEAFCWHASDLLAQDGHAGLLIHATTLVNEQSSKFRKAFFAQQEVKRITNFSNLSYRLFESAEAPAATVVFTGASEPRKRQEILHFGPFVANQLPLRARSRDTRAWSITIYENEVQWVDAEEAVKDENNLWKVCLWGTYHDRRTLSRLRRILSTTLGAVIGEHEWLFGNGQQLRERPPEPTSEISFEPALQNQDVVDMLAMNRVNPRPMFIVPAQAIRPLEDSRCYMRRGKSTLGLTQAPHLILNATLAVYSDDDFVIPHPQVGLSAPALDAKYLKAISVFLNSNVARYTLFFTSVPWGISVSLLNPSDLRQTPFPKLSGDQVDVLARVYDELAAKERTYLERELLDSIPPPNIQAEVDNCVESLLNIPANIGVVAREFMEVRYELNKGKPGGTAAEPPQESQLIIYAERLRNELDTFAKRGHKVSIVQGREATVATVEITRDQGPFPVSVATKPTDEFGALLAAVREKHSQWVYVQRGVRLFEEARVHIIKTPRLLDWTQTQAFLDAGDIIGDVLSGGK